MVGLTARFALRRVRPRRNAPSTRRALHRHQRRRHVADAVGPEARGGRDRRVDQRRGGQGPELAGKPWPAMCALVRAHVHPGAVVGDRASTDGRFAAALGVRFAHVVSQVGDETAGAAVTVTSLPTRCWRYAAERPHARRRTRRPLSPTSRRPLDRVLVERALAPDLEVARALVAAGRVLVAGAPATSPSRAVAAGEVVSVLARQRFVGRGGDEARRGARRLRAGRRGRGRARRRRFDGGLHGLPLTARRATGPQRGRRHAPLHERLRDDPRVISLEQTNLRAPTARRWPRTLAVRRRSSPSTCRSRRSCRTRGTWWSSAPEAALVVLVKPQFEVDHVTASRGRGVVTEPAAWSRAVARAASAFEAAGAGIIGVMASALVGASGNVEFFLHARRGHQGAPVDGQVRAAIEDVASR